MKLALESRDRNRIMSKSLIMKIFVKIKIEYLNYHFLVLL